MMSAQSDYFNRVRVLSRATHHKLTKPKSCKLHESMHSAAVSSRFAGPPFANPQAEAGAKRLDLGGRTVLPGFIDAHLHTASSGLRRLKEVRRNGSECSEIRRQGEGVKHLLY